MVGSVESESVWGANLDDPEAEAAGDKKREGPLSLSGWHIKALGRVCGEPVVLRLSRRGTVWP